MDPFFSRLVNQEVAGFRLVQALGEGGMAAVFKGENVMNPAIVRAIKIVRPELASRTEFTKRFSQEAVILEKLRHPNVVGFYGLRIEKRTAAEGDLVLMELELLEGETLTAVLHRLRAAAPLRSAVEWVHAAAKGVAAAHDLGVVHRDLKPDNIFLTTTGDVKVLDFGIARAHDDADRTERLTAVGTVPGSPAYMAPEICTGAVPAATGDVYALGITLVELLTGAHPFSGASGQLSSTQLMFAHVNNQIPPLREARPDAPVSLEQVVTRATAKDPSWRYATAGELASALNGVLRDIGGSVDAAAAPGGPIGTQFALPQMFKSGSTPASGARTSQADLKGEATSSRTQTTGSSQVMQGGAAGQPKSMGGIIAAAVVGVLALGGGGYALLHGHGEAPATADAGAAATTTTADVASTATAGAAKSTTPALPVKNRWIRVDPPGKKVLLGVSDDRAPGTVAGFRPARKIAPPSVPYDIQQHEVTWEEMEPWLQLNPMTKLEKPEWLPADAKERGRLPVTGITWDAARVYCKSIGGSLPTEEEWEYAARGADRRPNAWGSQRVDLARSHAYVGPKGGVVPVMTSEQDATPGDETIAIYDMMGNAREWTVDLFRDDKPGVDDSWVQEGGLTYRAVRGLPLASDAKNIPAEGAAHREALCATGPCPGEVKNVLQWVGFRCTRAAKAKE